MPAVSLSLFSMGVVSLQSSTCPPIVTHPGDVQPLNILGPKHSERPFMLGPFSLGQSVDFSHLPHAQTTDPWTLLEL